MRNVGSLKDVLAATVQGRVNPRQIFPWLESIQFAAVGELTHHLIREKGLGRQFPH
jgi:hypothetical protein